MFKNHLALLAILTTLFATSTTATANEPREVDGVPCEVCVSEKYLENHRELVRDYEARIDDLKEKRAAAAALAEERKDRVRRLEAKLDSRPNRWAWFGIGSASTVAVVAGTVALVLIVRR